MLDTVTALNSPIYLFVKLPQIYIHTTLRISMCAVYSINRSKQAILLTLKKIGVIDRSRALLTSALLVPLVITNIFHPLFHPHRAYKVPRRKGERQETERGRGRGESGWRKRGSEGSEKGEWEIKERKKGSENRNSYSMQSCTLHPKMSRRRS